MFFDTYCVDDWHPNQKFIKEILVDKIASFIREFKKPIKIERREKNQNC